MLIFLDIDGVMVPAKGWKCPELLNDGFPAFSSRAIRVLQGLISGDTTIVLTTSHKSNYSLGEWREIFGKRGINIEKIKTLDNNKISHRTRRDEILNWFTNNSVNEDFIIIDDDKSLNELPGYLKKNLILTSPLIGLTEEHLEAVNIIRRRNLQLQVEGLINN